ncbi:MAG: glycosyltransferase [Flavobacteriales bacterium]
MSILGKAPDINRLISQIRTFRIRIYCSTYGVLKKNTYPYIQAIDIFVIPLQAEGISYVVLEALMFNKAIVYTGVVGPREFLRDRKIGAYS